MWNLIAVKQVNTKMKTKINCSYAACQTNIIILWYPHVVFLDLAIYICGLKMHDIREISSTIYHTQGISLIKMTLHFIANYQVITQKHTLQPVLNPN